MAEAMDWAEVKRRLLDGTSVQILADLNGVTYKTMYNRIMAHQVKDGVTYLTPGNTKGLKKAKAISKTKQAQAREKEKAEAEKVGREIVEGLPKFEADPEKKPSAPEVVPVDIPEGFIEDALETAKQEQAKAVKELHYLEYKYQAAKKYEAQCRAIVMGLQMLLNGGKLPEVDI